ncbi:glycosyltransferase family 2 protein [Ruegeria sp. HKCCSP351]|uniref:glycosyltransferase family 2 protein n=1 Tax=Ruegeria sp. HKCCSP351 TaxID=2794832 RepID=UPI0032AF2837
MRQIWLARKVFPGKDELKLVQYHRFCELTTNGQALEPRVTIISVTYNSVSTLPQMLASVPDGVPIVLVDNGSDDLEELERLAQLKNAKLILNDQNVGFGVGCNQGAAGVETEFLLFLNPDARLLKGSLEKLLAGADRHKTASAFNPAFTQKSGKGLLKRSSVLLPRKKWLRGIEADTDLQVPILSGAALLVRRSAFEKVGGFDANIFLYHEDDDICLRLDEQVGPLFFLPEAEVTHIGGKSSPRSPKVAAIKAWHMGRSRVYAARKHKRPAPFLHAFLSALLQAVSPLVLFSERKRAKQMAFLRAVWSTRYTSS